MKKLINAVIGALLLVCLGVASAQSLKFATGEAGKGYSKLFRDINKVCGDKVPLEELNTTGGPDNVTELAAKHAQVGLVQVDVFQSLERTDDSIGRLKAVMALNANLLHIIVNQTGFQVESGKVCDGKEVFGKCIGGDWKPTYSVKKIEKPEDLKGLTVAAVGSAQVLARRYLIGADGKGKIGEFNILDVDKDPAALAMLKKGEVHAVLTMAAHPHGVVDKLTQKDGFQLVGWNIAATGSYRVVKKNYKGMGAYGTQFLAAPNMLMSRPVDPNGDVGKQVTALKACIASKVGYMQDSEGFEPSWAEATNLAVPDDVQPWTGVIASTPKKK